MAGLVKLDGSRKAPSLSISVEDSGEAFHHADAEEPVEQDGDKHKHSEPEPQTVNFPCVFARTFSSACPYRVCDEVVVYAFFIEFFFLVVHNLNF